MGALIKLTSAPGKYIRFLRKRYDWAKIEAEQHKGN